MEKHAYLIIAHNNFYVLEKALQLIDDERNDIYIHIDKKVNNFDFDKYSKLCKYSNVIYTKKRYNCRWGGENLVKAEMRLFSDAYKAGKYDYFHLISGADLPIKSQNYIYNFFENNQYEFVELAPGTYEHYKFRISRYHIKTTIHAFKKILRYIDIVQDKFNVDRLKKSNMTVYKGSQWVSLSSQCVLFLLKNKKKIMRMTRFSLCADEIYKQTIILNSHFSKNVYPKKDIRLIDWERHEGESPHTFTIDDYDMIKNSECLFARKFIADIDKDIIDKIFLMVKNEKYDNG